MHDNNELGEVFGERVKDLRVFTDEIMCSL
jgi:hypothetical protein